jgi:hypothetical protein
MGKEQSQVFFHDATQGMADYPFVSMLTDRAKHRRHAFYKGLVERDDFAGAEFEDEVRVHRFCISSHAKHLPGI